MLFKYISNTYNLVLSFGAFYLGISMISEKEPFDTFPKEWLGLVPFDNWSILGLFGIIVFGIGNAVFSVYAFSKKDKVIFLPTLIMGLLFSLCVVIPTISFDSWYLPTSMLFVFSLIQILLGLIGLIIRK